MSVFFVCFQANIALLKNVENNGKTAQNLFINALRQTGQHYLANLLDDGIRIKALSGSGKLGTFTTVIWLELVLKNRLHYNIMSRVEIEYIRGS